MFSIDDYRIGWLCNTPATFIAALAALDQRHPNLPVRPSDYNTYTLGRISGHNVVLTCVPHGDSGLVQASIVAAQMMHSFGSIRFVFSLGIAGGAPHAGIRLGDIVVSHPTGAYGGVIQYDMGKSRSDGSFERTGSLSKPPPAILTAVSKLRATHMMQGDQLPMLLSKMASASPRHALDFAFPGVEADQLFEASYLHQGNMPCSLVCDSDRTVRRYMRQTNNPKVYYGLIASGNALIRDGKIRDKLSHELDGLLCFDLEAAGLMDHFPCLAIRGISDYADSHNSFPRWHHYAAATATAYAKELLSLLPTVQVAATPSMTQISHLNGEPDMEHNMEPNMEHNSEPLERGITNARVYSHEDYTIGWICALPLELATAMASLESIHPDLPIHPVDHNTYVLGNISGHNIVVACLPTGVYGTVSAAIAAAQLVNSFPAVRFGLLVGIGGGVPSLDTDIRLGDVAVSRPRGEYSGVVEYDRSKVDSSGELRLTGHLNSQPAILRAAQTKLEIEMYMEEESRVSQVLSDMLKRYPAMREAGFGFQGETNDVLYQATYRHSDSVRGYDCVGCEPSYAVPRGLRDSRPVIHYGNIGSGNWVVKDAFHRDDLARRWRIICFEMEAAGVVDILPCIVIRGVCDYADSHKNKRWQRHAAASAAAYATALLGVIQAPQTKEMESALQSVLGVTNS
jgi:nucleoside phosphorylase